MRRVKLYFAEIFAVFVSSPFFLRWLWMSFHSQPKSLFFNVFFSYFFFYILHHLCLACSCSLRFILIFLINQNSERSTFCCFTLLSSVYVPGKHTTSTWSTSMVALFTVNSCCKCYSLKPKKKRKNKTLYAIRFQGVSEFEIRCAMINFCVFGNRDDGFLLTEVRVRVEAWMDTQWKVNSLTNR